MNKNIVLIILLLTSILGCREKENIFLGITPAELEIQVNAGDPVYFRIDASSDISLRTCTITRIGNALDSVILDTVFNSKSFYKSFAFQTPPGSTNEIKLLFKLTDEDGNVASAQRIIFPTNTGLLAEYTNQLMYTFYSANLNAYNFSQISAVTYDSALYAANPSLKPDLRELNNDPNATPFDLSRLWFSPSGGKFVKTASLNFSTATNSQVTGFFDGNYIETNFTDTLQIGDIYAYKSGGTIPFYCLIKIDQLNSGSGPASYVFTVKK